MAFIFPITPLKNAHVQRGTKQSGLENARSADGLHFSNHVGNRT